MPEVPHFGRAKDRPEEALLLACARVRVTADTADRIRTVLQKRVDWMALIRLAMRHNVTSLLLHTLQPVCPNAVPSYIEEPLRARHEAQKGHAQRLAEELVRVLAALEKHGIRAVPYKGPALAQRLYGDLSLREFGDLDVSIRERDVTKTWDVLRGLGYEFSPFLKITNLDEYVRTSPDCELTLKAPQGITLELHWRFARRSASVRQDPKRFLKRLEAIQLAGARVPSLPLETYYLILSMHAAKHKWGQLKLICDFAEILGQDNLDWNYVAREAKSLGLRRMVAVSTLLAQDLFEAKPPTELTQGLEIDREAHTIATQIRAGLFEEADEHWGDPADYPFQFAIRERLRDRASIRYMDGREKAGAHFAHLLRRLGPSERDRRFLPMSDSFTPLYYLVRPVRWAWEKMGGEIPARETPSLPESVRHASSADEKMADPG